MANARFFSLVLCVLLSLNSFVVAKAIPQGLVPATFGLSPRLSSTPVYFNEWTAMGDSYAAGVGAGTGLPFFRFDTCYRYDGAYPYVLNQNLQPPAETFNFVACSGETFPKIIQNQLIDQASYTRPAWGSKPEFVTLSMGGNDIDILDLVLNCIYSTRLNTLEPCETVIQNSQDILASPELAQGARDVLNSVVAKGTKALGSTNFKVFLTGYAQFFNNDTTQCNDVTFKLGGRLNPFPPEYLTTDRRQTLNKLARDLNVVLKSAVLAASIISPGQVFYIDIDAQFDNHRFCDREEPNPDDPETWFFTVGSNDPHANSVISSIPGLQNKQVIGNASSADSYAQLIEFLNQRINNSTGAVGNNTGDSDILVEYVRAFHPKVQGAYFPTAHFLIAIMS